MALDGRYAGYHHEEEFIKTASGLTLFTCRWLPAKQEPKALVFLCHGYGMECSVSMKGDGIRLANEGFAVYGIDCEGHGKSAGLKGYISSFDRLVVDCSDHFISVCEKPENMNRRRYLFGESMGGAVAICIHQKDPRFWDGAVLVAPMCKISERMRPHPFLMKMLTIVCNIIPTWKWFPPQDIINISIRNPQRRKEVRSNVYCYKGWPRIKTAYELLTTSMNIEKKLTQVSLPFLLVHGGDDMVTDTSISKLLYESASSSDKTFKLYPGMWHSLISGELPENIERVYTDILHWLNERACGATFPRMEIERKLINEQKNKAFVHRDDCGLRIPVSDILLI